MNACRTCHAPGFWAKTATGKSILIDRDPVPDGNLQIFLEQGEPIALVTHGDVPGKQRYKAHFATCPHAAEHRRPREGRRDGP